MNHAPAQLLLLGKLASSSDAHQRTIAAHGGLEAMVEVHESARKPGSVAERMARQEAAKYARWALEPPRPPDAAKPHAEAGGLALRPAFREHKQRALYGAALAPAPLRSHPAPRPPTPH